LAGRASACKDQVLELLGGWAAVRAAGLGRAADGCAFDFKKATTILRDGKLGRLKRWKRRALSLMRRPENMRAVVLVAERLETQGWLTGSDVQLVVASAVE
jgi:plasmid replication initiation protein